MTSVTSSRLQRRFKAAASSKHVHFQFACPLIERLLDHVYRFIWTILFCDRKRGHRAIDFQQFFGVLVVGLLAFNACWIGFGLCLRTVVLFTLQCLTQGCHIIFSGEADDLPKLLAAGTTLQISVKSLMRSSVHSLGTILLIALPQIHLQICCLVGVVAVLRSG